MTTADQARAGVAAAPQRSAALRFVLLIGAVSFFADFAYEGTRSVTGPFLAVLGASGTVVGSWQASASCSGTGCESSRVDSRRGRSGSGRSRSSAT